jgi:hypothetical protein
MRSVFRLAACAGLLLGAGFGTVAAQGFRQTQADDYTRYELLEPSTRSFRILYDVTATTAGATHYFNAIRRGSEPTVHSVTDLMTGTALRWRIGEGAEARASGMQNASAEGQYIAVELARPVPERGEARIRIDKTYRDTASYRATGDGIVFERLLGIDRNAIVLPPGYELTGCNVPSQVAQEADGRIRVSFMNAMPSAAVLVVRARRSGGMRAAAAAAAGPPAGAAAPATAANPAARGADAGARVAYRFGERAFEDREIVYFLQQPETHSFRLYHDYTETRAGVDRYLNVVRAGSSVADPSATALDTGERLRVETLRGQEIRARGLSVSDVTDDTEVVAIWFDPVKPGQSLRLRIEETYTDPGRYLLHGDELVWDRAFGRARNAVVLPEGWSLTASAMPAVVSETADGRIRLDWVNDRPGDLPVFLRARRR